MRQMRKDVFVALANRKIEMYQAFQKVLDIVLSEAKGKDGKMINKRFIDSINELIGEDDNLKYEEYRRGMINAVRFCFSNDWAGKRNGRFEMYYSNRYVSEVNSYLDWNTLEVRGTYLKDGKYLDYDALSQSIENEKNYCFKQINELTNAIDGADEYIQAISHIKAYVESSLKELPEGLYTTFRLEPAIY